MAKFKIDTAEVGTLVAAMETLCNNFDTSIRTIDLAGSCGSAVEELGQLCKSMQSAKEELKELMQQTVAYLKTAQITFDEADMAEASKLLEEMGIKQK